MHVTPSQFNLTWTGPWWENILRTFHRYPRIHSSHTWHYFGAVHTNVLGCTPGNRIAGDQTMGSFEYLYYRQIWDTLSKVEGPQSQRLIQMPQMLSKNVIPIKMWSKAKYKETKKEKGKANVGSLLFIYLNINSIMSATHNILYLYFSFCEQIPWNAQNHL